MRPETFAVLAEPTRWSIIEALKRADRSVGELVEVLALPQPAVSKHLKVLRDGGFVVATTDAQRRIYSLAKEPFVAMDAWLKPYVMLWSRHLNALERHLDQETEP